MATTSKENLSELITGVRGQWHRFVTAFEPLRPDLYRFCRALTRNAFDAEDLVQESLMRGFIALGRLYQDIENPRSWLFRVASNAWIDRQRTTHEHPVADLNPPGRPSG